MHVVEVQGLTKDYEVGALVKKKRRALSDLTLSVDEGETFGLIGPNGAGKSTTLKLLMGLIFPTGGTARLLGKPVGDVDVKAQLGYLPENPYFYDYLTGHELLDYFGRLFDIDVEDRKARIKNLLERVGLVEAADLQLRKYSKGMTQRLGIAQALLNNPRLVFLDEPMSGLDPMGRRDMTNLIRELRGEGVTVVFASHILPDVEALCDRVAILNLGKLVREGRLSDILDVSVDAIEVTVEYLDDVAREKLQPIARKVGLEGSHTRLEFSDPKDVDQALEVIRGQGLRLVSLHPVKQTLEQYFVSQVNEGSDAA
jgi:ABC-2 type transport system ATP-binding protein